MLSPLSEGLVSASTGGCWVSLEVGVVFSAVAELVDGSGFVGVVGVGEGASVSSFFTLVSGLSSLVSGESDNPSRSSLRLRVDCPAGS